MWLLGVGVEVQSLVVEPFVLDPVLVVHQYRLVVQLGLPGDGVILDTERVQSSASRRRAPQRQPSEQCAGTSRLRGITRFVSERLAAAETSEVGSDVVRAAQGPASRHQPVLVHLEGARLERIETTRGLLACGGPVR